MSVSWRLDVLLFALACPLVVFGQTVTRFEESDPRITYTGTWYPNSNSLESGGKAALANLKGSQASVVFNGTGIDWIGYSDGYTGICYVTLDGVQTTVDTGSMSGASLYRQSLFSAHNLAPGLHRMTIEIIHGHDGATNQSWIWVDAFDIDNGALVSTPVSAGAGLAQQTDVAANYVGHWFPTTGPAYSGGSMNSAVDAGARVDFSFNGTAVTWIGYRDEYSGNAQVLIDGALQNTVDTYATPAMAQTPVWSVSGLSAGTHILSIEATGTHDSVSGGSSIWVDAFQVSGSVASGPPAINANGFVSAASFIPAPNNQVAPGQIVSIFGQNFTAAASASATAVPLPTRLSPQNTSVMACGVSFPLYNVFPGQINAQLPLECPTSGTVTATISAGGQTGTQTFAVAPAAPGIFTVDGSGAGAGVILHANNSLVSAAQPATPGETVVIYATGLGPTVPAFPTGAVANLANNTALPVTVTIGTQPATVVYAGLTQGLVGLYQVNAVIPAGLAGTQPVAITVDAAYSSRAGVTITLQ
ncbi:MAG: hypothetical protein M3N93_14525 [Acidobacteriota bacterium]|nr:hypothetical protein [Acidobacteriota bacterium]